MLNVIIGYTELAMDKIEPATDDSNSMKNDWMVQRLR